MAKDVLVIDRSKWLTGSVVKELNKIARKLECKLDADEDDAFLYIDDFTSYLREERTGMQCCLGFACRKAGFGVSAITDRGLPSDVKLIGDRTPPAKASAVRKMLHNLKLCYDLAAINDKPKLAPKQREGEVKRLMASVGVKVKFIGRYPSEKQLTKLVERVG